MPYIAPRGSPSAKLWIVLDKPFGSDIPKGFLLSGGMGFVLEKMLKEAKLDLSQCYCVCRRPNTDDAGAFAAVDSLLNQHQPPIVLAVEETAAYFLPSELQVKGEDSRGQLQKYAGSLMQSKLLNYEHYLMPLYGPETCVADWAERNVTTYVDLQKTREELEYWRANGRLKPLPERTLKYNDMELDELLSYLDKFRNSAVLSDDIENPVYKTVQYTPHPGFPFLLGLADSSTFGISFKLFRDKPSENRELWRRLDKLLYEVPVLLGQNFFNYDALFHNMLGFKVRLDHVQDTLIRHHILWPELSHKLQFLTRQYTREPYYKDEGKTWSFKYLNQYRRYNALDATVTFEVYERQEEEFAARPHLRG